MLMHTKEQDIYQGWSSSTDDKQKKKRAKLVSAFWQSTVGKEKFWDLFPFESA